ncbi:hypothetical protein Chor_013598 [Crotalus horridus]
MSQGPQEQLEPHADIWKGPFCLQIRNPRHYAILKELLEGLECKEACQKNGEGCKSGKSVLKSRKRAKLTSPPPKKFRVKDESQDSN